ncbi:MAG: S8 family serine peptidase [Alistipes sp.]|nr:S8 family serine peptidase [Alistipes sp.]
MVTKKSLLFAALAFAACSSDPLTDIAGSSTPDPVTVAAQKIVNTSENAVPGSLLIYFDDEAVGQIENSTAAAVATRSAATRAGIESVDEVLDGLAVSSLRRVFPCDPRHEERTRAAGLHKWYIVEFDADADLDAAARKLAAVAEVERLQFDTKVQRSHDFKATPLKTAAVAPSAAAVFNDPQLSKQWHYINNGNKTIAQTSRVGADINVEEAWKLTGGDNRVVVAIVDEGVKYTHPDLAANMWTNPGETSNGQDSDGNGYVDDLHGWNFATNGPISWDKPNADPQKSDSGHGTHVAGTVAAVNNNGVGVCGVAGGTGKNDGVKLMSCQVFSGDSSVSGSTSVTAQAFYYAANNGASIAQCSFGYSTAFASDDYYKRYYSLELNAITYFINAKNCDAIDGGLVIFAAGNESDTKAHYPGAYYEYISVTAFGPDYLPAYYTNYGPGCNIAAPGGDYKISEDKQSSMVLSTLPSELYSGNDYGYMNGTSMACPHVSGVAALGLSYALQLGKSFTLDEFKAMLLTSVNDIDQYFDGTKDGNNLSIFRQKMGTGSVDAYQLLMQVEGTPCLRAKVGTRQLLSLTNYFGGGAANLTYLEVKMTDEEKAKVGITENPTISYGKLRIQCNKPGVARITITAVSGGPELGGSATGGQTVTKEFAVIARATTNTNGGWL